MLRTYAFLLLFSFPSLAADICPFKYFSGWYCDAGDAVHCAYDYNYGEYYEDTYLNCNALPNSYGCFLGSCSCIRSCAHGYQNRDCSCSCSYPWNGQLCEHCVRQNYECKNNNYIDQQTCQCHCANKCLNGGQQFDDCGCACPAPWTGSRCETCTRSSAECANGGQMDPTTCKCTCPQNCQNGGTRDENCKCSCPYPWTGPLCQTCSLSQNNCANNSTLNSNLCQCNCVTGCQNSGSLTRTCDCTCPYPWAGTFCGLCSISAGHCKNNATFDEYGCQCDCADAIPCEHSGRFMSDFSCGCDCSNGWVGDDCSTCGRDPAFCLRGGKFQNNDCNCNCTSVACKHGRLNERCQCLCENGYKGEDCSQMSSTSYIQPSVILGGLAILLSTALNRN